MKLIEAYPKDIAPTELSQSNNEIINLSVTFTYRYWTTLAINRSTSLASTVETFNRDQRDIALRIIAENTPKVLTRL